MSALPPSSPGSVAAACAASPANFGRHRDLRFTLYFPPRRSLSGSLGGRACVRCRVPSRFAHGDESVSSRQTFCLS